MGAAAGAAKEAAAGAAAPGVAGAGSAGRAGPGARLNGPPEVVAGTNRAAEDSEGDGTY